MPSVQIPAYCGFHPISLNKYLKKLAKSGIMVAALMKMKKE